MCTEEKTVGFWLVSSLKHINMEYHTFDDSSSGNLLQHSKIIKFQIANVIFQNVISLQLTSF